MQGIYKITNTVTGTFYIGSSANIKARWRKHKNDLNKNIHSNQILLRSWKKYGPDAFRFEVIEEMTDPTLLLDREQTYLDALRPPLNICLSARKTRLGLKHSPESIERMRKAQQNRPPVTQETREKIAAALQGRKLSPATIEKVRQSSTGRIKTPAAIAKMRAANVGKRRTDEEKKAISNSLKARFATLEGKLQIAKLTESSLVSRAKLKADGKKRTITPEGQEKINQALKNYYQTPEGQETRRRAAKMGGQANLGKPLSAERRAKISAGHYAFHAKRKLAASIVPE